jgi:protein-tyrosine phosphatase
MAYTSRMRGFVDLHCHWIANIDDGARSAEEGIAMLEALAEQGFDRVIATPHMRPGLFDNTKASLTTAFEQMQPFLLGRPNLPRTELSSEHYFDAVIFERILSGNALPYPGGHAVLLEFYEIDFPLSIRQKLFELRVHKLLPVIAHPERYQAIWKEPELLERLVEGGAAALLDSAALIGKYGKRPRATAELLLERGVYHAACSDAHRPDDVSELAESMDWIEKHYGEEELEFLFKTGPEQLLLGNLPE